MARVRAGAQRPAASAIPAEALALSRSDGRFYRGGYVPGRMEDALDEYAAWKRLRDDWIEQQGVSTVEGRRLWREQVRLAWADRGEPGSA
jgi:hypothetical protein